MHEISVVPIKHVLHYCSITSPTGPYFFFPEPWDRLEIGNGPSFSVLLRSLLLLLQVLSPSADSESTPMEGQIIEELTLEAQTVLTIIGSDYNFSMQDSRTPMYTCMGDGVGWVLSMQYTYM